MLSLAPGYARLEIPADEDFSRVSESLRALLDACRLNGLAAALVASRQSAQDWRSSLRIGIRFAATRVAVQGLRVALIADHFSDGAREDVLEVAGDVGLDCRVFRQEDEALAWLRASDGAAPGRSVPPGSPRR